MDIGKSSPLHIFFLPFMAHGHMIPVVDMAKLFAARGVKATLLTTPLNAHFLSKNIERSKNSGLDINVKTFNFPCVEVDLPEGCENIDSIKYSCQESRMETVKRFFKATTLLQGPIEQLLQEFKPDCLIADMFFPWSTDAASKFAIPRLVFHGFGFFSLSVSMCLRIYEPHKHVESDSEPFLVPNFPGDIALMRKQLPHYMTHDDAQDTTSKMINLARETEGECYGVIVNSFYELESSYADYFRNVLGRKKAWCIGPISLCNKSIEDKSHRGKNPSIDENDCLKWLESRKPNSIIYICFGSSQANFSPGQLKEIALWLEASSRLEFIWVVTVRENDKGGGVEVEAKDWWLSQGFEFEKRMEGRGLIIRGWAPQALILDHQAVGGFVTHCGWNSTLESVCAGVPMVTWPRYGDQFYNEKLVTEVLEIGVAVGGLVGDFVKREEIEQAVEEIMVGERAEEIRRRAKKMGEIARKSVELGGSSYSNLNALIDELVCLKQGKLTA